MTMLLHIAYLQKTIGGDGVNSNLKYTQRGFLFLGFL